MIKIFRLLFSVAAFITLLVGCTKDKNTVTYPSFDTFVAGQPSLSMFTKAVEKANLKDFTTGPGPFTWFAPTDAAFAAIGLSNDTLNKMTPGAISYLLTYHLVNAAYLSENMVAVSSISRTTQSGAAIYSGSFNNGYFVNGGKITSIDNQLSNGYIHIIDRFLVSPVLRGNDTTILKSTGQHTLFIAALRKTGVFATIGSASIFTVMAPTDAAMISAGYTDAFITATPAATLLPIMRYHYFNSVRLFTNDFAADLVTIATAAGPSTSLTTSSNGTMVKGKGNATPVKITSADLLGTNGVVHVIDGVLRP